MCGIFGIASDSFPDLRPFYEMQQALVHRGPDSFGMVSEEKFVIGVNRLKIIGLQNGDQPIWNEDKSLTIVGNGEVYNYRELRKDPSKNFSKFSTQSDIEAILKLYEIYGIAGLDMINGMFGICIIDREQNCLILARDPLGEKPLYYTKCRNGEIYFSSELTALIKAMNEDFEVDTTAFSQYLKYSFVPESNCIIKGISKVAPGGYVRIDLSNQQITVGTYAKIDQLVTENKDNSKDLNREKFLQVIKSTLNSEVPIAIGLSSGLDSSMLLKIASSLNIDPLAAIIEFEDHFGGGEALRALEIANSLGVRICVKTISGDDVVKNIQSICAALDEPLADPASIGYFFLALAAKENYAKVLITGQGADELFWGYNWLIEIVKLNERRWQYFNSEITFLSYLRFLKPHSSQMGEIFDYVTSCFGMFDNLVIFFSDRKDKKNQKFTVKVFSFRPNHRKFKRLSKIVLEKDSRDIDLNEIPMPDSLELVSDCVRLVMLKTYLPTIGLAQTDRLGMHHSIECRAPFANYEIVQMILRDRGSLFSNGVRKARMKSVFKTMFTPDQLRSKKNGFQIPIKSWIAEIINSKEINLHNSSIFEAGLISEKGLKILTQPLNHLGRIKTGWYELLVFELWFRNLKDCLSKREKL